VGRRASRAHHLLDGLFKNPVVNVKDVKRITGLSQPAANALANTLATMGILSESTGGRRNRVFMFDRYLALFEERGQRA
jgi:Fic family protein